MSTQAFIDLFIHDTEAGLGHCDDAHACVTFHNTHLFFKGATRAEAHAVADAINAAIEGAKRRAAVRGTEPSTIAAE
jgi:hypothetical protein